jgi:3-oxoacyl-[acyl-carrier protein] reductase
MPDFSGRVALVTGANKGIGLVIARMLAEQGASVAVNVPDRSVWPEELLQDLRSGGKDHEAYVADVSVSSEVKKMVQDAIDRFGKIDILINNAAVFPRGLIKDLPEDVWDRTIDVNLKGTFLCSQAVLPGMMERHSGRIVNLTSGAGFRGSPNGTHYSASKAGIVGFTRGLALEVAQYGIAVNAVAPGITDTDQPRGGMSEDEIENAGRINPSGRIGTSEDVARAVLYLASMDSDYITGQTLHVNGGNYLS